MNLRPNVGFIIMNSTGLFFAGVRTTPKGAWQLPQGGIEEDEAPETALIREMEEETGINKDFKILAKSIGTYEYLVSINRNGIDYDGQKQIWFLIDFFGSDEDIKLGDEFSTWAWLNKEEIIIRAVDIKKPIYEKVFLEFSEHLIKY